MFRAPGKEKRFRVRVRVVGVGFCFFGGFGGFLGCLGVSFRTHFRVFFVVCYFLFFSAL